MAIEFEIGVANRSEPELNAGTLGRVTAMTVGARRDDGDHPCRTSDYG
jgi:hypothetical protein